MAFNTKKDLTTYRDRRMSFHMDISISIRQTVKTVYPQINDATIHSWMAKGVFHPYIYEPPPTGPGRGCKLDVADLVTIGVLHSLLKFGVTFKELKKSDLTTSDTLNFMEPIKKPLISFAEIAEGMVPINKSERKIQTYLEKHQFKVWVTWSPIMETSMFGGKTNFISFFPHKDRGLWKDCVKDMEDRDYPALGHVIINCQTWHVYVNDRLGIG
jgi:hypothetical protein